MFNYESKTVEVLTERLMYVTNLLDDDRNLRDYWTLQNKGVLRLSDIIRGNRDLIEKVRSQKVNEQ